MAQEADAESSPTDESHAEACLSAGGASAHSRLGNDESIRSDTPLSERDGTVAGTAAVTELRADGGDADVTNATVERAGSSRIWGTSATVLEV